VTGGARPVAGPELAQLARRMGHGGGRPRDHDVHHPDLPARRRVPVRPADLLPDDGEMAGLLALMLLIEARRTAESGWGSSHGVPVVDENSRPVENASLKVLQGLLCLGHRVLMGGGPDVVPDGEREELPAVGPGVGGNAA
jgi:hypothetical protein